ncbi:MAG: hypothetical protein QOE65_1142 [Solirubrobacteraceae bacterium]|jgi:hypothetical protein|nr:hypothetical protein [Solirubrobacteraceae bacterium]
MSAPSRAAAPLSPAATEVLAWVAHHRLLSSGQVHRLRAPGASRRWTLIVLGDLQQRGLLAHVRAGGARKLWHATALGAKLAADGGLLDHPPKVLAAQEASGALQAHTLAVNDVGICFAAAARERGDELGPLGWRHEVAHPLPGRGRLIADALLTYLLTNDQGLSLQYRLLELDRATQPAERLAAKLRRYAQLHNATNRHAEPAWRTWYPAFPGVLVVLDGGDPAVLQRRRRAVLAVCAASPDLSRTPQVAISICLLADLQAHGPFAPVFLRPGHPDQPADWLGRSAADQRPQG